MMRVVNADQFNRQVAGWISAVKRGVAKAVWRMAYDAQEYAMSKSPIYSGDFGSNWNVSVGSPDLTFRTSDLERQTNLWGRGSFKFDLSNFKVGTVVYLTNNAVHDDAYAEMIERDEIAFRPWNVERDRVDRVLGKTHRYIGEKYKKITKGMMV